MREICELYAGSGSGCFGAPGASAPGAAPGGLDVKQATKRNNFGEALVSLYQ